MFHTSRIFDRDKKAQAQLEALLQKENIQRDRHLDYTLGIFHEEKLVATGSGFKNTLRCIAVDSTYQGEGLMNTLISALLDMQQQSGYFHCFVYTKKTAARFFKDLGFYPIAETEHLVFLENKKNGFSGYLDQLQTETARFLEDQHGKKNDAKSSAQLDSATAVSNVNSQSNGSASTTSASSIDPQGDGLATSSTGSSIDPQSGGLASSASPKSGAIIMNANPFTLGHQYLVETAAKEVDVLHLFVVSDDSSLVPYPVRKQLVMAGTAHLNNIVYHDTKDYLISMTTFPAYFLKDDDEAILAQSKLDVHIFEKIAQHLQIQHRFIGDEPFSHVTNAYNQVMIQELTKAQIQIHVLQRKELQSHAISASKVRELIQQEDWEQMKQWVPASTYAFFVSPQAQSIVENIKKAGNVVHY